MKQYRLEITPAVELEIGAALAWYEGEEAGLGFNSSMNCGGIAKIWMSAVMFESQDANVVRQYAIVNCEAKLRHEIAAHVCF